MAGFLTSKPVLTKRLILDELEAIEREVSGDRHFAGGAVICESSHLTEDGLDRLRELRRAIESKEIDLGH